MNTSLYLVFGAMATLYLVGVAYGWLRFWKWVELVKERRRTGISAQSRWWCWVLFPDETSRNMLGQSTSILPRYPLAMSLREAVNFYVLRGVPLQERWAFYQHYILVVLLCGWLMLILSLFQLFLEPPGRFVDKLYSRYRRYRRHRRREHQQY